MFTWAWIISAICGSIIGNASSAWFENTKLGEWFFNKINTYYNWAAGKMGIEVLKAEDKWRKKYPNIANRIDYLENKIKELENGLDN